MLEAESWGLLDVVYQAARGGHHDVCQAAEAVCSVERRVAQEGRPALTTPPPDVGTLWTVALRSPGPDGYDAAAQSEPTSRRSPQTGGTYVSCTRLSCSLASDFCPVTRATRRGVAPV